MSKYDIDPRVAFFDLPNELKVMISDYVGHMEALEAHKEKMKPTLRAISKIDRCWIDHDVRVEEVPYPVSPRDHRNGSFYLDRQYHRNNYFDIYVKFLFENELLNGRGRRIASFAKEFARGRTPHFPYVPPTDNDYWIIRGLQVG